MRDTLHGAGRHVSAWHTFGARSQQGREIVRAMSAIPQGQAPQRVCPKCSTVARTVDAHCPYCGSSYRRRGPWLGIAFATLFATAAILLGVLAMLVDFGDQLDNELEDQVDVVQRDFDRDVRRLEDRIEGELDERLPPSTTTSPSG